MRTKERGRRNKNNSHSLSLFFISLVISNSMFSVLHTFLKTATAISRVEGREGREGREGERGRDTLRADMSRMIGRVKVREHQYEFHLC